jgi:hypothetical protein
LDSRASQFLFKKCFDLHVFGAVSSKNLAKNGKISHEHIYWDQASVLVQIGLLNPAGLPVEGAEIARKVVNPQLPSRPF